MASEDPRLAPACVTAVPGLLRQGAEHYAQRRFWHAHETWEEAWHSLRAAREEDKAAWVRGMILVTAAFENATRGKEAGFKRQMAEGLHALLQHEAAGAGFVERSHEWTQGLLRLYVDACRRRRWEWWNGSGWTAPPLRVLEGGDG